MSKSDHCADYDYAINVLAAGDQRQLAELEQLLEGFPHGTDNVLDRCWIINAISCGSQTSIELMLSRGVDLTFRPNNGWAA